MIQSFFGELRRFHFQISRSQLYHTVQDPDHFEIQQDLNYARKILLLFSTFLHQQKSGGPLTSPVLIHTGIFIAELRVCSLASHLTLPGYLTAVNELFFHSIQKPRKGLHLCPAAKRFFIEIRKSKRRNDPRGWYRAWFSTSGSGVNVQKPKQ